MGKLTLLLLALLVWLQYSLWFGKNGLHDYSRVNDDVAAQQATNAKLRRATINSLLKLMTSMAGRRRLRNAHAMNSV
jgi:cell division protein FtsB